MKRYLKLFTFLSVDDIDLLMSRHRQDASKRVAQHLLAGQIVELVHGAAEAKKAETAHKEAFSHGTNTFPLGLLRTTLASIKSGRQPNPSSPASKEEELLAYKKAFAASHTVQSSSTTVLAQPNSEHADVVTLPITMLQPGSFPRILYAAGLVSSKSEAHRLLASKGAYVLVPNSGSTDNPTALKWEAIEVGAAVDPNHFLVDWEMLVLRVGKSKIHICRVITKEQFKAEGLTYPS